MTNPYNYFFQSLKWKWFAIYAFKNDSIITNEM